jgi:hypothetical protein
MNLMHQFTATRTGWGDLYTGALKESCISSFAFHNATYQHVKYDALRTLEAALDWSPELYDMLLQCTFFSESGRPQSNEAIDGNMEHIINLIKGWGLTGQPEHKLKHAAAHCTELHELSQELKRFLGVQPAESRFNGVAEYVGERSKFRLHLQRHQMSAPRAGSLTDLFPGIDASMADWRAIGVEAIETYHVAFASIGKKPNSAQWKPPTNLFISAASRAASEAWGKLNRDVFEAKILELRGSMKGKGSQWDGSAIKAEKWITGKATESKAPYAQEIEALLDLIDRHQLEHTVDPDEEDELNEECEEVDENYEINKL